MFELAALGLLQREPLHGYRLKQKLELFMSSCISVNYGTIYPLLRRLEKQGAIVVSEEMAEGSSRKVYRITPKGQEAWKHKMLEHPHESWVNARSRFLIKLFFFSDLQPAERVKLMNHRLVACQLRLENLENQNIEHTSTDPYEAMLWNRHLKNLRAEIKWLKELLLEELPDAPSNNHLIPTHSVQKGDRQF